MYSLRVSEHEKLQRDFTELENHNERVEEELEELLKKFEKLTQKGE